MPEQGTTQSAPHKGKTRAAKRRPANAMKIVSDAFGTILESISPNQKAGDNHCSARCRWWNRMSLRIS
jgi:hypothetical protein